MSDERTTEQKLSDLQDRYRVLASEHETLKREHAALLQCHARDHERLTELLAEKQSKRDEAEAHDE